MPTAYVRKLAKKHGVSTATSESKWSKAKAAAEKQGHGDDYGYVTSIYQNMMHEELFIPTLKDLTRGMTFKYFLVGEAEEAALAQKERSPIELYLDKFPQYNELPSLGGRKMDELPEDEKGRLRSAAKARHEIKKLVGEFIADYETMPPEEKESVDAYVQDLIVDKMGEIFGHGANVGDWAGEEEYKKREAAQAELDRQAAEFEKGTGVDATTGEPTTGEEVPTEPVRKKRASSGPRHIAAMRQQNIPTNEPAAALAGSEEVGAPVKSYYKPWSKLSPEQLAKRSALAKKHGTLYRVKNAKWFRTMAPNKQEAVVNGIKGGMSVSDAKAAADAMA